MWEPPQPIGPLFSKLCGGGDLAEPGHAGIRHKGVRLPLRGTLQ